MVSGWRFLTFPCGRTAQYATFVEEGGITLDLRDDTEINVSAKKGFSLLREGMRNNAETIRLAEAVVLR